ncbi:MAG: RNA polymerase sigma factor [Sphingobacteriaceae bacterium]
MLKTIRNETELLKRIAEGSEEAFSELFYGYHNQLGSFIFSITGSSELSEEIVQDIFLKIWKNRLVLVNVKEFNSYLFILSRNHTLNEIRKLANQRKQDLEYNQYINENAGGVEPDSANADYYGLIDHAIGCLPPQQQKVYLLKQQGYKNAEVAYKLDISLNSVKKYQQWALQSILKFVKSKSLLSVILVFYKI